MHPRAYPYDLWASCLAGFHVHMQVFLGLLPCRLLHATKYVYDQGLLLCRLPMKLQRPPGMAKLPRAYPYVLWASCRAGNKGTCILFRGLWACPSFHVHMQVFLGPPALAQAALNHALGRALASPLRLGPGHGTLASERLAVGRHHARQGSVQGVRKIDPTRNRGARNGVQKTDPVWVPRVQFSLGWGSKKRLLF